MRSSRMPASAIVAAAPVGDSSTAGGNKGGVGMVAGGSSGDEIELRFRLIAGTDIGPHKYPPSTTVLQLKEAVVAKWPAGIDNAPKTAHEMKLIHSGKVLENNKTLGESVKQIGDPVSPRPVVTMHVVVRPAQVDKVQAPKDPEVKKPSGCGNCTIL
eukprot:TRINITY_DN4424_c1_g1_i1.p1 TRINITY_DN4424_c1_g1~~TRINITY_DN4424_c1_g1_i1.p1  ORF type:complete len:157 (+),score=36.13 TRINITY_DN4424_c1_g1_i1:292-762(+)